MGFSPGEFYDLESKMFLHWEGGPNYIQLWTPGERSIILTLTKEEARKASDQLALLADMIEEDRL